MKTRVKMKNTNEPKDYLQDTLEIAINTLVQDFFDYEEVKKYKLKAFTKEDIISGALVTAFTKNLAFVAAKEKDFDSPTYLTSIFDSMSYLFSKYLEGYSEALKDKGEKNSSLQ